MTIKDYDKALGYLFDTIPHGKSRFPGNVGIERQKILLGFLGDPQNKVKVVHIAGTSGKGSVASYLSSLLTSHGFKVGMTISPHILDIRERIQINKEWITQNDFIDCLNEVIKASKKIDSKRWGKPTYFEIMIAIAFLYFYKKKVDYAVVETGMGGLMDGTNTIDNETKIAVITRLGLDHTSILGKRITDIAYQKTGIIQNKNQVIALWQRPSIRNVFETQSLQKSATLEYVKKGKNFKNVKYIDDGLMYDFKFKNLILKKIKLNNFAIYQVENTAIALTTFETLRLRDDFKIELDLIKKTIEDFKFSGRMEIIKKDNKIIVLDGAHNPQKMNSFIKSLSKISLGEKYIFVIAFKQRKDFSQMLKMMIPLASKFIFTSFVVKDEDMVQISQPPKDLIKVLDKLNFKNYQVILNSESALKTAIKESNRIVVTSSLYLLRKIYTHVKSCL